MPLWASWLKDFDILNIFYDELKIEKMAKFEILIATNGLIKRNLVDDVPLGHVGLPHVLPVFVHLEYYILDGLRGSF